MHLVEQLTSVFPAFDDHREVRGEKVFFLKRAQLVVASLHRRFKVRNAPKQFLVEGLCLLIFLLTRLCL